MTLGQGFTITVDTFPRWISGLRIKNKGAAPGGAKEGWATKEFRVWGSLNKIGPYQTLLHEKLADTSNKPAPLLNFTFEEPVEIKFLKLDLMDKWGLGGGLQYFAAIPCEYQENKH